MPTLPPMQGSSSAPFPVAGSHLLVTGGGGFIGSWLVRHLLEGGARVTVVDDLSTGTAEGLADLPGVRLIRGDVLDRSSLDAVGPVDGLFHLAGVVGMRLARTQARLAYRVGSEGTRNVLEATGDVPAVLFSSSAVYGYGESNGVMRESEPLSPSDIWAYDGGEPGYAGGKLELERRGLEAAEGGRRCLIVRPFNVLGPGQSPHYGMVLPRFIDAAREGRPLRVYDDGLQTRSFCDVRNFVRHLVRLAGCPEAFEPGRNVINLGNARSTSVVSLAEEVVRQVRPGLALEFVPYETDFPGRVDVRHRKPCIDRARELLGELEWAPVEEIVAASVRHADDSAARRVEIPAPWQRPRPAAGRPRREPHDVVVLGAGVAGLAAAWSLGDRACVVERDMRPGGLVRTDNLGGFWFDHVLHLLHLSDPDTGPRVRALMGGDLAPCPPEAFVECSAGEARYPLQDNLRSLEPEVVVRCLEDFATEAYRTDAPPPQSHEDVLLRTFGRTLCEIFFFPYQGKMWKRPLSELAPSGFQWNISRPDFRQILRGALDPDRADLHVYNENAWYPRPGPDAPVRGMEILSRRLAEQARHLRLGHEVVGLEPEEGRVRTRHEGVEHCFEYTSGCISTLPLPRAISLCRDVPDALAKRVAGLAYNRVRSVMLAVRGPRPKQPGLWRYYADPSLVFTRVTFMTEFDPLSAPPDGFGLLVEVTERSEDAPEPGDALVGRVVRDLQRVGCLQSDDEVVATRVVTADPAYVVFSPGSEEIVVEAREFLQRRGIETLGRYGRWEYSSMESAIRDGLECGDALGAPAMLRHACA